MERCILELCEIFNQAILEKCKDKKILLGLTGGHDTRTILSSLMHQELKPDCFTWNNNVKNENKIASTICKRLGLNHQFLKIGRIDTDTIDEYKLYFKRYDIVLSGKTFNPLWGKYENLHKSEEQYKLRYETAYNYIKWVIENTDFQVYDPSLNDKVIKKVKEIPIIYRMFSYLQRQVIYYNYPKLLRIPFTDWNTKINIARISHLFFMKMLHIIMIYS